MNTTFVRDFRDDSDGPAGPEGESITGVPSINSDSVLTDKGRDWDVTTVSTHFKESMKWYFSGDDDVPQDRMKFEQLLRKFVELCEEKFPETSRREYIHKKLLETSPGDSSAGFADLQPIERSLFEACALSQLRSRLQESLNCDDDPTPLFASVQPEKYAAAKAAEQPASMLKPVADAVVSFLKQMRNRQTLLNEVVLNIAADWVHAIFLWQNFAKVEERTDGDNLSACFEEFILEAQMRSSSGDPECKKELEANRLVAKALLGTT